MGDDRSKLSSAVVEAEVGAKVGCCLDGDCGAGVVEEGLRRWGEPPPHSDIKERTGKDERRTISE